MPPVEVKNLESFKECVHACSIRMVYCLFEANPQGDPPIGLRLYFYHRGDVYFLIDFASGERLKVTGIPVQVYGSRRKPYIAEEDVKAFINRELKGITVSFDFEI